MITAQYPRSQKEQVGGLCHLGRLIDKVRMRNAGQIQDYNYLTVGFDKYLLDKLEIKGEDFEKRVLQGGTDAEIADWVKSNGKNLSDAEKAEWNDMVLTFGPKAPMAQKAFDEYKSGLANKRGVSVESLSHITTWCSLIEHDEGRK
ncbi:MAG TPA: DUF5069 domain-containing protein [Nitrospirales bacterium]|nr:DUF5069 domain-containing protein [Nitrospirales bacterium]